MLFYSVVPSPKDALSPQQIIELTNIFLEGTNKSTDCNIVLILCHHAEATLSAMKRPSKKSTTATDPEEQDQHARVAEAYFNLGKLMDDREYREEAKAFYKKAQKFDAGALGLGRSKMISRPGSIDQPIKDAPLPTSSAQVTKPTTHPSPDQPKQSVSSTAIIEHIFPNNVRPPAKFNPPEPDGRLIDTPQLTCCLALLQDPYEPEDILDTAARNW
ncbi:hypothetical protein BGX31_005987, partial [Mortierella sp. GBA43]